jgi:DNA polymerase elongation subunit (family B)
MISGYKDGSDLTIMNAMYHYGRKDDSGKFKKDNMTIVFKDNVTGKKDCRTIYEPTYTYYKAKDDVQIDHNLFFIESEKTIPITTPFKDLEKSIAEQTGQLDSFYDNIKCGNRRANRMLHLNERIFGSDLNINNYYRKKFGQIYKNDITPINKSYLDIEANIKHMRGDFPEPGECPINALSILVDKTNTLYTFVLREHDNPLIKKFEEGLPKSDFVKRFKELLQKTVGGYKKLVGFKLDKLNVKLIFFDDELDMLTNAFRLINITQPDFVLAWNMGFDMPYIIQRLINLGVDPKEIICHPDFSEKFCEYFVDEQHKSVIEQRGDYADIASYSVYLDQMIQFGSRRKGQSAFGSFKLDDIGEAVCKVNKLSYKHITTDLAELPYLDFETFIMYNMMDVIVQKCIEEKTGDVNYVFSKAIANSTMYQKAHRQTVYLANRAVTSFLTNNDVIAGNNVNKFNEKPTEKYAGAFVADPIKVSDVPKVKINGVPVMVYKNANDFDYKRLYPSITQEFNMAPNTQVGMIEIPNTIYAGENPNNDPKFSRAGAYVEDLASRNYLDFCKRWLNLGGYREVYDDIVEYFTMKKTPSNGTMDLKLSMGIRDIAFRLHKGENLPIVQRHKGNIKIVDRYLAMPKHIEDRVDEYRKAMKL